MPFTPFHFGPGALLHSAAPKRVSFLAFCAANVLVDVEPGYYLLTGQYPVHRFFHTVPGVTAVVAATVGLWWLARCLPLPDAFGWRSLTWKPVLVGAALGGYSHVLLDSVMHSDIRPLAPFSDANPLLGLIPLATLHWGCVMAGFAGLALVGWRRWR